MVGWTGLIICQGSFLSCATFLSKQRVLPKKLALWDVVPVFIHLPDALGFSLVWRTSITRKPDQQNSSLGKQMSQVLTDVDRTHFISWLLISALFMCLLTSCDCDIIEYLCDPWFSYVQMRKMQRHLFVFISRDVKNNFKRSIKETVNYCMHKHKCWYGNAKPAFNGVCILDAPKTNMS